MSILRITNNKGYPTYNNLSHDQLSILLNLKDTDSCKTYAELRKTEHLNEKAILSYYKEKGYTQIIDEVIEYECLIDEYSKTLHK